MTPDYVRAIGMFAFHWAWPMVNLVNRQIAFDAVPASGLAGGVMPVAPVNHMTMLTDYIQPSERYIACPNQDVVYGLGIFALDREPVVIQVPDFGDRFWVYQVGNQRTDGIAQIGQMYGTRPGFYLLVGPNWKGETPAGFNDVIRSTTNLAYCIPRVFKDDTEEDGRAIVPLVGLIGCYPLSEFDGDVKVTDWSSIPSYPAPETGGGEVRWVRPETFTATLSRVLAEVPPLPGEDAIYGLVHSVLEAAAADNALGEALESAWYEAEDSLVNPYHSFVNVGYPVAHGWTTIRNGAGFGTDYVTRTAVAKSNIFVNQRLETTYFYQEQSLDGSRLNGEHAYTFTIAGDALPQVHGFWSLTLYDEHHFFVPNELSRYSLGTKSRDLFFAEDGSLTIYVQKDRPHDPAKLANWLPSPEGDFELYVRTYWPDESILNGEWTPPAVIKVGKSVA